MALFGGICLPGKPDPLNIARLDLMPDPMIREMMKVGFAIDKEHLYNLSDKLSGMMKELREEICGYIPEEKLDEFIGKSNLNSDDDYLPMNVESGSQLARLLFEVLGVGEGHHLRTTKSGVRVSTGKKQLEVLKRTHPVIRVVLRYRECSKLKSTYVDALPEMAVFHPDSESWRVHTTILDTRTDTGRLASKNPNLQNIPVRTELGRSVRAAFIPSDGCVLVGCDFSQIELRDMAHCANEQNLIGIYEQGKDVHEDTAMRAFGISDPKKVDKLRHRAPCKNVNFGIPYGLTEDGLYDQMAVTYATAGEPLPDEIDKQWCKDFIAKWFDLYPGMRAYQETQHYRARRYGMVWDVFGRVRLVPETRSVHERVHRAGLRQAGNMPIQGCSAEQMKLVMAMLQVNSDLMDLKSQGVVIRPLITVHDELIFEVEESWGSAVGMIVQQVMRDVMRDEDTGEQLFRVPIDAEAKVMERWEKE